MTEQERIAARFNVVCPDKVIFNLSHEDAMRTAHIEYERAKQEYMRRFGSCGMVILAKWRGVKYWAWDNGNRHMIVYTERVG